MVSNYLIYGLVDPRNGHLRYIGKSSSGLKRPRYHSWPSCLKRETSYKTNWIKGLVAAGLNYQVVVIQELDGPEGLGEVETGWIRYFRETGHPLTNLTDGGEGGYLSEDTRRKISAKSRGRKMPPRSEEYRKKQSLAHMGREFSRAHCDKISLARTGVKQGPHSEQHRLNLARAQGAKPFVCVETGERFEYAV
jgi:hypothetical protein